MKRRIRNMYQATSIKTKWIIFVIILVLYPMILIGYVGYANYEQVITKHFIETVQKDILVVAEQLQEELEEVEKFTDAAQKDEAVYEYTTYYYNLLKANNISMEHLKLYPEMRNKYENLIRGDFALTQKVTAYLKSLLLSRQDISAVAYQFAGSQDFGTIETRDKNDTINEINAFERNKVYENMNRILEKDRIGYYVDEENNVYLGKKIFYRLTSKHCGTAIFKLDMTYLLRKYAGMLEGAKEAVYVVADAKNEIMSIGNLQEQNKKKLIDFQNTHPQPGVVYREESRSQAVVYNTFEHHNLSLGSAVYISLDILLADIRAMSRFIFILCMSVLPIFLVLANKLYKEIIQPIYILSGKMQQIENGEMGVEVKSERTDEFGYVFGAFNGMSRQLKYLVNCVYKEQIALKNAELKVLRSQINPHFLYNTLEMINWKARMTGNDDLSEMIGALSGIMEVNIDRRSNHFLTIAAEMDYIKNYIFLIQKRFGDGVQFTLDIEEELMTCKIPKLIIQPIVENALKHGVEARGKGLVCIEIKEIDDQNICIWVKDNGKGIPEDKLLYINKQLEALDKDELETEKGNSGHIGVINVQKRIKLLYGESYGIEMKSQYNEGTQVRMVIPKTYTGE
ncbi:MAG: sensor histidine kinase [Cellulosilyticaceae bacterium]